MLLLALLAQTPDAQPSPPSGTEGGEDLLSQIGSELTVVVDRWSAGQIGASELAIAAAVIAVAALGGWVVRRQVRRLTANLAAPAATAGLAIGRLVSLAIYLLALSLILEVFGFSLGPVVIIILIAWAGIVISRPLMMDLNAGLILQVRGSVAAGDLIETNGIVGTVDAVNSRSVVLLTNDGKTVDIPSREVLDKPLTNFSSLGRRRSEMTLDLPEGADVAGFTRRLRPIIDGTDGVLHEPAPQVVVSGFDGTRTTVTVLFWHPPERAAERMARDSVGRAVLELLDARSFVLADEAIVVKGPADVPLR